MAAQVEALEDFVAGDPDAELFPLCARFMRGVAVRDTRDKLQLYALFKQAMAGDVATPRPGMLDFSGRAKWDARDALRGTTQTDARAGYIEYVLTRHGDGVQDFCVATGMGNDLGDENLEARGEEAVGLGGFVSTLGGPAEATTMETVNSGAAGALLSEAQFAGLAGSAAKGDLAAVRAQLVAGADKDARDDAGRTALHWAAEGGYLEVVDELLGLDAAVDVGDGDGQTALIIACLCEHVKIATALVAAGADVEIADEDGDSAVSLARTSGNEELRTLLSQAHG